MEDDSVRVLDKCMLDGHFDETKENVLKKLQEDVRNETRDGMELGRAKQTN